MSTKVILTLTGGELEGTEYAFAKSTGSVVGRAADCDVQIPSGTAYCDISRYHCRFDIDPPRVRVCDVGSKNGTPMRTAS